MTRIHGTTCLLIAFCLVFVLELGAGLVGDDLMLLHFGGLPGNGQVHGQYWRLLSYAFLHASPLHIAINCGLLLLGGPVVERRYGIASLLALFTILTILGGIAILLIGRQWPNLGTYIGASAGATGLFCTSIYVRLSRPKVAIEQ
jgi:membrane associated rhomboid family serine protease